MYIGVYPQDMAYPRDKQLKMVCMSTGYCSSVPLPSRKNIGILWS